MKKKKTHRHQLAINENEDKERYHENRLKPGRAQKYKVLKLCINPNEEEKKIEKQVYITYSSIENVLHDEVKAFMWNNLMK